MADRSRYVHDRQPLLTAPSRPRIVRSGRGALVPFNLVPFNARADSVMTAQWRDGSNCSKCSNCSSSKGRVQISATVSVQWSSTPNGYEQCIHRGAFQNRLRLGRIGRFQNLKSSRPQPLSVCRTKDCISSTTKTTNFSVTSGAEAPRRG